MKPKEFLKFDRYVEPKFREFAFVFLKKYKDNPTREKFLHLILNLPLGFILRQENLQKFIDKGTPSYNYCSKIIKNLEHHLKEGDLW